MSEYTPEYIETDAADLKDGADIAFQMSNLPQKELIENAKQHAEAPAVNEVEALPTTPAGWAAYYSKLLYYMRAEEAGAFPATPVASTELAKAAFSQDNYGPAA